MASCKTDFRSEGPPCTNVSKNEINGMSGKNGVGIKGDRKVGGIENRELRLVK